MFLLIEECINAEFKKSKALKVKHLKFNQFNYMRNDLKTIVYDKFQSCN